MNLVRLFLVAAAASQSAALSLTESLTSRRAFASKAVKVVAVAGMGLEFNGAMAMAAPDIITTDTGIKFATLKQPIAKGRPRDKDIVAIEYTGYLTDGSIFDATHAEGKQKALVFELGGNAVNDGINEMVRQMEVGQKVQAIIPPKLAFGSKGICLPDGGECLVKPNSYLVYDIYLKRSAIPPP